MQYSNKFKENFIEEFLTRYKNNPGLSFRQYGIEKFGKVISFTYKWLQEYDVNHIYDIEKAPRIKKSSPIVKITNTKNVFNLNKQAKLSISFHQSTITIEDNYSKEDLLLILSTIKEL